MRSDRLMRVSERWFRLLLRFYPAGFREEMGEALVETYRDRSREASKFGGFRVMALWCTALRDSVLNGLGERARPAASWRRDLALTTRRFRQKPLFFAVVLATLTVGLGAFAVVFTAVDKILLEPLPYPNPDDLYMVWHKGTNVDHFSLTGPSVVALQQAGGVIEAAAGMQLGGATLHATANADASRISFLSASINIFNLLGVQPARGRGFLEDDVAPNATSVVALLSDEFWKRLGGDPAIIGSELKMSSETFKVIGVMPPGFAFSAHSSSGKPDIYIPLYADLAAENPQAHDFWTLIRARRGASREAVEEALGSISRYVEERDKAHTNLYALGLQEDIIKEVRPALVALAFAVVFLVLVLTANLASLLLARASEREREFAVTRALGAPGTAVVRASLIEGGLLGLIGGVTAVLIGIWGTHMLVTLASLDDLPQRDTLALDWDVAVVVITVGCLLGLMAAAAPALWAARTSLSSLMAASAVRGGASSGRMRRSLVVVQVALSLVLLSAGGLVVRSFERLLAADPGFRPEGLLTMTATLPGWLFEEHAEAYAFQDRVFAAIRALPGVTAVSATNTLPLFGGPNVTKMEIPGAPTNNGDEVHDSALIDRIFVREGYVETMGMRVLAGRAFGPRRVGIREAMIDAHLAKQFFPNGSPIGATLRCEDDSMTIIGVFDQARLYDLHQDGRPQLFVRADDYDDAGRRPTSLVIRTTRDPRALIPDVRSVIRQLDRRVPVMSIRTMEEIVANRRSRERISAVLISGLALGALLLVAMGLFGVISGSVTRRRGELAVRLALGATHGRVIRLVVGEGARLIALGLLIGIPGVYMSGQAIQGLLVDVSPFDRPTLAAVAIGLAAVGLLACYLAARRATSIEPAQLLREGG